MAKNDRIDVPEKAELKGYKITFKNFAGRESSNGYNRAGNRNFCVVLDDETAQQMLADGWNVRIKQFDDGSHRNTLQVAVRYDIERFRPRVVMVTPKGNGKFHKTLLNEDTVAELDSATVTSASMILNPSPWHNAMGNGGIKAYLTTGYFVIEKDPFEDDFPSDDENENEDYEDVPF